MQQTKQVRYSEAKIRSLLHLQQTKDLTVAKFCQSHRIARATFYNWRSRYMPPVADTIEEKEPGFVPVSFDSQRSDSGLFAEVRLSPEVTVKLYQKVEAAYFKAFI